VEDAVGQATMRILAARMARFQSTASNSLEDPCSFGGGGQTMASRKQQQALDRERVKLRLMPPTDGQAWYGISAPDGSVRQYVAVKKRRWRNPNRPEDIGDGKEKNDADSEFFYDLLYRVEENGRRRKLQKEMEEREKNQANAHQIEEMDCEIVEVDEANANGEKAASRMASALWTDKYAPRSFLDLLSLNVGYLKFYSISAKEALDNFKEMMTTSLLVAGNQPAGAALAPPLGQCCVPA
jgi:hypothetical protein